MAIVVSRYHSEVTSALRDAAVKMFKAAGGAEDDLLVVETSGSFELTAVCAELADIGRHDGIVALGCIISGETTHDQYIAQAVASGLTSIAAQSGLPIAFGVLTCQTIDQARARAGGDKGNKGAEAMIAAIETAQTIRALRSSRGRRSQA